MQGGGADVTVPQSFVSTALGVKTIQYAFSDRGGVRLCCVAVWVGKSPWEKGHTWKYLSSNRFYESLVGIFGCTFLIF